MQGFYQLGISREYVQVLDLAFAGLEFCEAEKDEVSELRGFVFSWPAPVLSYPIGQDLRYSRPVPTIKHHKRQLLIDSQPQSFVEGFEQTYAVTKCLSYIQKLDKRFVLGFTAKGH